MAQHYPLEWLDTLISLTLNPAKIYLQDLTKDDIQSLSEKALIETTQIQSELKNQVFSLHKESQLRLLVQKYHSALIILLDTVKGYEKNDAFEKSEYCNLSRTVVSCLDELLFFIEVRFANFLSMEERVPSTYLNVSRKELKLKLDHLQKKLVADVADPIFSSLVLDNLYKFVNAKKTESITFRELLYRKELVQKLELLGLSETQTSIYNALNELLIYMNFNSRSYINYFTRCIANKINGLATKTERIDSLHFHFKEFRQMHTHRSMILYPEHQTLKAILSNWFEQEIAYLEKTMHLAPNPIKELKKNNLGQTKVTDKLTVNLSVDQIALILRAADESKLLHARSMSDVFKKIVPHLSTANKSELSYDSVRSKSYNAEERDKAIAIEVLEKLIRKLKTY
ncbi:hypothetical protein [Flavobacterium beibuense]|uniref:Uncharacterized protein n=1 Tax=Flavobacterium beibuense TaxID=657326 RepID=A0A444WEL9_9FLAO|nr:hypothetical protein [Flavobacterium beibuense]RYJ44301.1 hypothetical protein NU09_0911 [Flavobacterium beibuense]